LNDTNIYYLCVSPKSVTVKHILNHYWSTPCGEDALEARLLIYTRPDHVFGLRFACLEGEQAHCEAHASSQRQHYATAGAREPSKLKCMQSERISELVDNGGPRRLWLYCSYVSRPADAM
jgi:hypothetical protein